MKLLIIIVFSIMFISCSEEIVNEKGQYDISGKIFQKNKPASNTKVELRKNDKPIKETVTDIEGNFKLTEVPKDDYILVANKSYEDGGFVSLPTSVSVNSDLILDNLLLPDPVVLYEPFDVKSRSVSIRWAHYSLNNFYEYKLYRHNTSGLDETTGTLIHVSTAINDTSFIDTTLISNATFYYRVYVNNDYGKLAGSNIQNATTIKWDNEINFTVFYTLNQAANFPGMGGAIQGVDFDGEYLWFLNIWPVKLVQYDYKTDRIIKEFEYNDHITPRALAISDTAIYVYYDGSSAQIKKISMSTGAIEREYSVPNLEDISIFKGFLYYTKGYVDGDKVYKLNVNDFSLIGSYNVPNWGGDISGIAHREGESWISSRFDDQIIILNDEGEHIGVVDVNATFSHLCFMENNIVIAKEDRVYIFEINN